MRCNKNTEAVIKTAEKLLKSAFISRLLLIDSYKKRIAFTLAEILVVLTIIGVIASMTIPVLVQDIQDQQFKVAWKSTFANLAQATKRVCLDNGGDLAGVFPGSNDIFRDGFQPYLNYTKLCNQGMPTGPNGCWHDATSFYKLSGTAYNTDWTSTSRMVLSNGTLLLFAFNSPSCTGNLSPNNDECGTIRADINGFKGPNKVGKDIFGLYVLKNGNVIPYGTPGDAYYGDPANYSCNVKQYPTTYGWDCAADFLNN